MKLIQDGEVHAIYEAGYWVPPRCDLLAQPLELGLEGGLAGLGEPGAEEPEPEAAALHLGAPPRRLQIPLPARPLLRSQLRTKSPLPFTVPAANASILHETTAFTVNGSVQAYHNNPFTGPPGPSARWQNPQANTSGLRPCATTGGRQVEQNMLRSTRGLPCRSCGRRPVRIW